MKILYYTIILFVCFSVNAIAGTLFRLPLSSHPGSYGGWFDHNNNAGSTKRYDCATGKPYDGHKGTDFPVPIGVYVLAGASGVMYSWVNNCPNGPNSGKNNNDRSCGGGFGNHLRIRHPLDNKVSISAHLSGVFTPMTNPGCGSNVGTSGNSGASDGPHLHYELRTSDQGTRLDFFGGSCNSSSYWVNQNNGYPTTKCQ